MVRSYARSLDIVTGQPLISQKTAVAARARRLLPSTRQWLRASECIRAAAFSASVGYGSWPNTTVCGRAAAAPRRPASRTAGSSPSVRPAMYRRSSTVR